MPILIGSLVVSLLLAGCAAYRITPGANEDFVTAVAAANPSTLSKIDVSKVNEFPEGNYCFEPMLYMLSLGIIPTHCVDTYRASAGDVVPPGTFSVTLMQGWVALFLMPSPQWQFGYGENVKEEIRNLVAESAALEMRKQQTGRQ